MPNVVQLCPRISSWLAELGANFFSLEKVKDGANKWEKQFHQLHSVHLYSFHLYIVS